MWNPKIVPCFMVPLLLISNITLVKSNELKKLKKKVVKLEKKVDDTQVEINTMKAGVSSTHRISLNSILGH
jgi:hypothetical protein